MAIPPECPHGNDRIETDGPYYRQVHPRNFQDGRVLPPAFILQDTSCHFTLSLNDGTRTTAERCHLECTRQGQRLSAAVVELTAQELEESGAGLIVDSPNEETDAHVDALYDRPMSRRQRRDTAQALSAAASRREPAYLPEE